MTLHTLQRSWSPLHAVQAGRRERKENKKPKKIKKKTRHHRNFHTLLLYKTLFTFNMQSFFLLKKKKFLGKRDIMATIRTRKATNNQRLPGPPPGLLSFVSPKDQRDFNNYLEAQYRVWKKVRDRLGYNIRRSYTSEYKSKKLKELTVEVKPPNPDLLISTPTPSFQLPIENSSPPTDLPEHSSENFSNSNQSQVLSVDQSVLSQIHLPTYCCL